MHLIKLHEPQFLRATPSWAEDFFFELVLQDSGSTGEYCRVFATPIPTIWLELHRLLPSTRTLT
jgi:hypothetical protein